MKNAMILLCLCLFVGTIQAQDTIYLVDGSHREGRVVEVTATQVIYFSASIPGDSPFHLSRQLVAKIVYEDGTVAAFQEVDTTAEKQVSEALRKQVKRNILGFSIGSFFRGHVHLSYERLSRCGFLGVKIPVSIRQNSFTPDINPFGSLLYIQEKFSIGIEGLVYPFFDYPSRLYFGASLKAGSEDAFIKLSGFGNYRVETSAFAVLAINAGYHFFFSRSLFLDLQIGLGFEISKDDFRSSIPFLYNMNFGIKF